MIVLVGRTIVGQLEDMALFVRIVEAQGISKAADQLNIAKSAVSRRLNELEGRLGITLLQRTTRKLSLTDAGSHYYERAKNIVDEVAVLNNEISGSKEQLTGHLKVSVPLSFGLLHLSSAVSDFATIHPQLSIALDFSDRQVDLVGEGFELAIRIGELGDSSYRARRLTSIRHTLCASPSYLKKHGEPDDYEDLNSHRMMQYGLGAHGSFQLTDGDDQTHRFTFNAQVKANNGDFLIDMARQGHGIIWAPSFLTYKAINDGELIQILPHYRLDIFSPTPSNS